MNSQDVIILGAGIVGKAASLALARKGLKVIHVASDFGLTNAEYSSPNEWDNRIYALSASSQKLLNDLQVWDAIPKDRVQPVRDMRVFGDSGQPEDGLHFSAFGASVPQLAWIVESNQIERALDLACQFQVGIERHATRVTQLESTEQDVILRTENGKELRAPLLIAADGANSPTRNQLQIETSVDDYFQTAVVANFTIEQPHLQTAYQWFLPGGDILALLPLPGKRCSMVWSTSASHAQELLDLSHESGQFCDRVLNAAPGQISHEVGSLELITPPKAFPLRRIWAKNVIGPSAHPHIILVGDAAHVMHPLAGQGLNLGLRDIAILKSILDEKESFRSIDDRVLLRRYERQRQGDTQALLTTTHHLQKMFSSSNTATKTVRNLGMRLINRSRFLKRQLIERALVG